MEELIDFCCAKAISRELLNLVCCSAHNLTEFSTLGRKCNVTTPAMIRVGFALNEPISLHTPQGNSHCGLLDPYQTPNSCLDRIRQLHEPGYNQISSGEDAVPRRSF